MDIFDKVEKVKAEEEKTHSQVKIVEDVFVEKDGYVYVREPVVFEKPSFPKVQQLRPRNGFFNRLRTKFFVKRHLKGNKGIIKSNNPNFWSKLAKAKCLDFSGVSQEDKISLLQNACICEPSFAMFLHKHKFDFDETIKNCFLTRYRHISYLNIIPFLKDVNVKDMAGNSLLLVCRTGKEAQRLIAHGANFDGFTLKQMLSLSKIMGWLDGSRNLMDISVAKLEFMFQSGVLGLSYQDMDEIFPNINIYKYPSTLKSAAVAMLGEDEVLAREEYYKKSARSGQGNSLDEIRKKRRMRVRSQVARRMAQRRKIAEQQQAKMEKEKIQSEVDEIFDKAQGRES